MLIRVVFTFNINITSTQTQLLSLLQLLPVQVLHRPLDGHDQLHVTQLVDHAQNALATIIAQDEADRKSLEDAKNAMGKEIRQVNKAGLAAAAYGAKVSRPNPQYTNHQG